MPNTLDWKKGKERTWLDDIFDACSVITAISYQLTDLSEAFHQTGNDKMGKDLRDMSEALHRASDDVRGGAAKSFKKGA